MQKPSLHNLLPPKRNKWKIAFFGMLAIVGVVGGGFLYVHHSHKDKHRPVNPDFIAVTHQSTGTHYIARVTGTKNACDLIPNSQAGWAFNGVWRKVAFSFPDDPAPNYSRPPGHQSFGLWKWAIHPMDKLVRLTVRHDCDGETVTSIIGPFLVR
jgi:hypothetical protein